MTIVALLSIGTLANTSSTTDVADNPSPSGGNLATLGPVVLIADQYGSISISCSNVAIIGSGSGNTFLVATDFSPALTSPFDKEAFNIIFGAKYEEDPFGDLGGTRTGNHNGSGGIIVDTQLRPDQSCVRGDVVVSIEGTLANGDSYEITVTAF